MLERKLKLEAEVKQLETTKRNWMTEVEIITKEMERLIQAQLTQQMEVIMIISGWKSDRTGFMKLIMRRTVFYLGHADLQ